MPSVSWTIWRASVVKPWPVSTAAQMTVATPSWTFTVAVETSSAPSAPSMCTMPRRVADAAAHRARLARALGAAGQQPLVLGVVLGQRRAAGSPVRPGAVRRPGPGRSRSGRWAAGRRWPCTLRSRSSAGSMPSFAGQLVHLALVGGADLHGALAADMAGRRVVGAHRPALDEGVRDDVRAAGEGDGGGEGVGGGVGVGARRPAGSAPRP